MFSVGTARKTQLNRVFGHQPSGYIVHHHHNKHLIVLPCQDPITLPSGSEPEPDFVIARATDDHYLSAHPSPKDVLLVIEIADSSLNYDQEVKIPLYAEAGISDYWIFNLVAQHLECYSEPYQELTLNFAYGLKRIFLPNQSVILPCFSDLSLDLSRIFPRITV
ncbi:MAG: Uma2 family endonuclease [Gloeotrichia echinulata IR180]|nr:Uma2 family endonuclease [Gloeotrichia echinulata DEX184]